MTTSSLQYTTPTLDLVSQAAAEQAEIQNEKNIDVYSLRTLPLNFWMNHFLAASLEMR